MTDCHTIQLWKKEIHKLWKHIFWVNMPSCLSNSKLRRRNILIVSKKAISWFSTRLYLHENNSGFVKLVVWREIIQTELKNSLFLTWNRFDLFSGRVMMCEDKKQSTKYAIFTAIIKLNGAVVFRSSSCHVCVRK